MRFQHIATCNSQGKLHVIAEILEIITWEILAEIESTQDEINRLELYLKHADFYKDLGIDRDALHYYKIVLDNCALSGGNNDIMQQTYEKISGMTLSDDEYVWETSSEILERYQDLYTSCKILKTSV